MKLLISVIGAVLLVSCQTKQIAEPSPPQKPKTVCENVAAVLSNEWSNHYQKTVATEIGRNKGCFGPAQQQRYEVTIR